MSWLEFLAAAIGSLAWPLAILAGFYIVRNNLSTLLPYLERLKYKDFELEFRKSVQELTERSRATLPPQDGENQVVPSRDRLYGLAEISPRAAILEAWLLVETAAAEALQVRSPTVEGKLRGISPLRLGQLLTRYEIISGEELQMFQQLRELRNKAVHVGDAAFHQDEVADYIAVATALAAEIRRGGSTT